MRKILLAIVIIFATNAASAQAIKKYKIEELKNSYMSGDSIYVINFWATFCKPCIEELPAIQTISKKYASSKVKLVLVSLDIPAWYPTRLEAFAKKNKITTNVGWLDESNADKFCPVIDSSWSGAIPATLIYNAKTGYKKFVEEEYTAATFEAALKEAIGEMESR